MTPIPEKIPPDAQILTMAEESDLGYRQAHMFFQVSDYGTDAAPQLLEFARKLISAERERCARIVKEGDTTGHEGFIETTGDLLDAISARILRA